MAVRPLPETKLAGQTSPSLIAASSSRPGIVTLGKRTDNTFKPYLSTVENQENQIPPLQPIKNNRNQKKPKKKPNCTELTKEESLESTRSSTTEILADIEKSHESELCMLGNDDNQQILLLETNHNHKLCDNFASTFMSPSHLRLFEWNWWINDINLRKYYKNDVTLHGPNLYLSGPIYSHPYPLLRAGNFDTIDFEYPLRNITCRLHSNDYNIGAMTSIVSESIQQDIHNYAASNNRLNYTCDVDEELEKDIHSLNIKWSVSGAFIAKPYTEALYNNDGSFDIQLHFNWNIDCIENDCRYNVFILPSHPRHRHKSQIVQVFDHENQYNPLKIYAKFRIYPYPLNESNNNNRKRHREDMEYGECAADMDVDGMKRRKLNDKTSLQLSMNVNEEMVFGTEEKEEFECKEVDEMNRHKPLQKEKRFKNKTSNRKAHNHNKHKTVQRNGRFVSVTMDKKRKNKNKNDSFEIDTNGIYRGYFLAIFVPRSSELYPFCTETMNLQPFIRGQVIFYDAIDADIGKPEKENYQWLVQNIVKTYKKKGKNLHEFVRMKYEQQQYFNQNQNHNQNNNVQLSQSVVFENENNNLSSKQEEHLTEVVDLVASSTSPQPPPHSDI